MIHEYAVVAIQDHQLIFSEQALSLLNTAPGERIAIRYMEAKNKNFTSYRFLPVIGNGNAFGLPGEGNILNRNKTISFRGEQNDILSTYGKKFQLYSTIEYPNIFFLVPVTSDCNI